MDQSVSSEHAQDLGSHSQLLRDRAANPGRDCQSGGRTFRVCQQANTAIPRAVYEGNWRRSRRGHRYGQGVPRQCGRECPCKPTSEKGKGCMKWHPTADSMISVVEIQTKYLDSGQTLAV